MGRFISNFRKAVINTTVLRFKMLQKNCFGNVEEKEGVEGFVDGHRCFYREARTSDDALLQQANETR